jgi:hypothetical protein
MGFSLRAGPRRLELTVGPFTAGSAKLLGAAHRGGADSPLLLLSDELAAEPEEESERLRVVMIDHRR